MSQQHQQNQAQQFIKTKQQRQKQKAQTSAWLKKQQQKKKKKLQQEQPKQQKQLDQKALEKAKRKQQKRLQREQMLKEQAQQKPQETKNTCNIVKQQLTPQVKSQVENKKVQGSTKENKKQKNAQKLPQQLEANIGNKNTYKKKPNQQVKRSGQQLRNSTNKSTQKQRKLSTSVVKKQTNPPTKVTPIYTQLKTLQSHFLSKQKSNPLFINKPVQQQFIYKQLQQYLTSHDTILILSKQDKWRPSSHLYNKRVYLYPTHEQFSRNKDEQNIICTYEDIAYLMEGTLTKIFVELELIFANGYSLTHKGHQNILTLANQFKIPVIGYTGTWNLNGWNYLSYNIFENKYGEQIIKKHDILQSTTYQIVVMQIGSIIPKQISVHWQNIQKIYRGNDLNDIKW